MNVLLCPDKEVTGPGPGWEEADLGRQLRRGRVPTGCPYRGRTRSHRLSPTKTATAIRLQKQGWGRGSSLPQGLGPLGVLGEALESRRAVPQAVIWAPSAAGPSWGELKGIREEAWSCLLVSTWGQLWKASPHSQPLLRSLLPGGRPAAAPPTAEQDRTGSWTTACLWVGSGEALANGCAGRVAW